jgi:predicted protein tyrosine phosphatase
MQHIVFMSRADAEAQAADPGWAVISISEPFRQPAELAEGWADVLRLEFDDVDEHGAGSTLFTDRMARTVVEYAERAIRQGHSLLVHCHAGVSRSASVAIALGQQHRLPVFNRTIRLSPAYSLHNKYVYRLLHRAMTGYGY